jgi:hypothetical protein
MILKLLSLALCIAAAIIGLFFLLGPSQLIELQRKFYEKINWRIEPVSLPKEIRNTRIMGLIILVFIAAALIFFFTSPLSSKPRPRGHQGLYSASRRNHLGTFSLTTYFL